MPNRRIFARSFWGSRYERYINFIIWRGLKTRNSRNKYERVGKIWPLDKFWAILEYFWKILKSWITNFLFTGCYKFCRINIIPLRFRKAGSVWCRGARDTHWVTFHNWVTVTKTKQSLRSSCFSRSLWSWIYLIKYSGSIGAIVMPYWSRDTHTNDIIEAQDFAFGLWWKEKVKKKIAWIISFAPLIINFFFDFLKSAYLCQRGHGHVTIMIHFS